MYLPIYQPIYLLTYLLTYLPICIFIDLSTYRWHTCPGSYTLQQRPCLFRLCSRVAAVSCQVVVCVRASVCDLFLHTNFMKNAERCIKDNWKQLRLFLLLLLLLQLKCKFNSLKLRILQYYWSKDTFQSILHKFHRCNIVTDILACSSRFKITFRTTSHRSNSINDTFSMICMINSR